MLMLSHQNFIKAREYILNNSDSINRAWFRYNFENMGTDEFMDELAKYQHDDGGFGGLVYEYEYNGSTLHDTEHAFRYVFYLKEKPPADHPVIQNMIEYILNRYRSEIGCWGEMLEPGVNDGIHVWWWTYGEKIFNPIIDEDERIRLYNPNGNAALAAFVELYSEIVPVNLYSDIIKYPIEKILRYYDENSPLFKKSGTDNYFNNDISVPYNLKCFQQFVACLKDKSLANKLTAILCQHPTACMQIDFTKWENGYEELPCDIVSTPQSVIYPAVKNLVDDSLEYLIKQQHEDGSWRLNFSFGKEQAFRKLENAFEIHLTVLILAELGRFGKIDL